MRGAYSTLHRTLLCVAHMNARMNVPVRSLRKVKAASEVKAATEVRYFRKQRYFVSSEFFLSSTGSECLIYSRNCGNTDIVLGALNNTSVKLLALESSVSLSVTCSAT